MNVELPSRDGYGDIPIDHEHGANPNSPTNALADAVRHQDLEIVQELVLAGADPKQSTPDGDVPLNVAQRIGNQDLISMLTTPFGDSHQQGRR